MTIVPVHGQGAPVDIAVTSIAATGLGVASMTIAVAIMAAAGMNAFFISP